MRIAIQKTGRLFDETVKLFQKSGFLFSQNVRSLSVKVENFPIEILFLRAKDIPEMIADGVVDLGIFGENIYAESDFSDHLKLQKKLDFGKCDLFLAAPENSKIKKISDFFGRKIATSHPKILKNFLKKKKVSAEIIPMSGSVEIAPAIKIADGICDLVSSGATLSAHNILKIKKIFSSEAAIFSAKNFDGGKIFNQFLTQINSVLDAKNLKSVVMNAPESALKNIKKLFPGLESPTVMPLAKKKWVAIHSVVREDFEFWEKISALKKAGARGILISPIDRVIF